MKKVNIKDLKSGPMWREELPPHLEKWANSIHKSLGDELIGPYERFEANFCRDKDLIKELFVWQTIASSLDKWESDRDCDRLEIFKQLLFFTMGAEVENTKLSEKDVLLLKQVMIETQKEILEKLKPKE